MLRNGILVLALVGATLAAGTDPASAAQRLCSRDVIVAVSSPKPSRHFTRAAALASAIRNWARASRYHMPAHLQGSWYRGADSDSACNRIAYGKKGHFWSCEVKASPCWEVVE